MGQQQPKESDGGTSQSGRTNATGNVRWAPNELKDRIGAKFQEPRSVNPAFGQGGTGSKGNPGKPT